MTRLCELRKKQGLTQKQIQMLTDIDQSNYSKIETEKRQMTVKQCIKLAEALDTSMDYLMGRVTSPEPYPPKVVTKKETQ